METKKGDDISGGNQKKSDGRYRMHRSISKVK